MRKKLLSLLRATQTAMTIAELKQEVKETTK
jgi:hypothetical protein